MKRAPKVWKLGQEDGRWFIRGLPNWLGRGDVMLIYEHPSGEVDTTFPAGGEEMLSALYGARQTEDGLEDGDVFEVDGRAVARVDGVHVVGILRGRWEV